MFVNREKEINRIRRALERSKEQLIILYGRRRYGKSALLKQVLPRNAIYFSADLREPLLQRSAIARQIEKFIPGFSKAIYPDWESLFMSLNTSLKERITLCIDEFPYLVKNNPELPSVLQKIIDNGMRDKYHLILCGSSQQMMHSMALDSSSPLYGRSDEILNIKPMKIRHMRAFMNLSAVEAINEYSIWGGVPRYWEIRKQYSDLAEAIKSTIFDQNGVLYEEPERLFVDEMRTSVQAFSILSLIGAGIHRPSEIAGRLNKPATQLSRPLSFLIKQGYIQREIPYGEALRSSKKSLYKINDPFMNFYFTFLVPNKSRIAFGLSERVWDETEKRFNQYVSGFWEEACRKAVAYLEIDGKLFNPARRWWGTGLDKKTMEIDVVAQSTDKSALLIGEAKWSDKKMLNEVFESLKRIEENIPFTKPKKIYKVAFLKHNDSHPELTVFTPEDIVNMKV